MAVVFSSRFQIGTTGVQIRKAASGETAGDNLIPSEVKAISVQIVADQITGSYPVFWVGGLHEDSEYGKVETGIFSSGPTNNDYRFFNIKSNSGTIWVNLFVNG